MIQLTIYEEYKYNPNYWMSFNLSILVVMITEKNAVE